MPVRDSPSNRCLSLVGSAPRAAASKYGMRAPRTNECSASYGETVVPESDEDDIVIEVDHTNVTQNSQIMDKQAWKAFMVIKLYLNGLNLMGYSHPNHLR